MTLKKDFLKINLRAQNTIEYVLLVAISIILLLSLNFARTARDRGFENHFNTVKDYITRDSN
jgi:hypothetical protein